MVRTLVTNNHGQVELTTAVPSSYLRKQYANVDTYILYEDINIT